MFISCLSRRATEGAKRGRLKGKSRGPIVVVVERCEGKRRLGDSRHLPFRADNVNGSKNTSSFVDETLRIPPPTHSPAFPRSKEIDEKRRHPRRIINDINKAQKNERITIENAIAFPRPHHHHHHHSARGLASLPRSSFHPWLSRLPWRPAKLRHFLRGRNRARRRSSGAPRPPFRRPFSR